MTVPGILAFLVFALLGSLAVLWSQSLYRQHRQRFIFAYSLHLAFWNALALLQITQYILGGQLLSRGAWISMAAAVWPLSTLLLGVSLLFFLETALRICDRPLARIWGILYLSAWITVLAMGVIRHDPSTKSISGLSTLAVFLLKLITVISCLVGMQVWARKKDPIKRAFIRRFAWVYLAGYLLYQLSVANVVPVYSTSYPNFLIASIQICFHFPVLAVMNRFLEYRARHRPPDADRTEFGDIVSGLGLTVREMEIIDLICQGYTNREIENKLFISLDTVKKHLFNIYKKLKVKNRVQLTNYIQNLTAGYSGRTK